MELRKDYEAIRRAACSFAMDGVDPFTTDEVRDAIQNAVERCQELADRPLREWSDAEKRKVWENVWDGRFDTTVCRNSVEVVDKIIASFLAKQREPETVKFRAARYKNGHVVMLSDTTQLVGDWEWLDADGKPQIYEVKV